MVERPTVTFAGGLSMYRQTDERMTETVEVKQDYIGEVSPKVEWVDDIQDGEHISWPKVVFETEYGNYTISVVGKDNDFGDFAKWLLSEIESGPENKV